MLRSGLTPEDDEDEIDEEDALLVNRHLTAPSVASTSSQPSTPRLLPVPPINSVKPDTRSNYMEERETMDVFIDNMLEEFPEGALPKTMAALQQSKWWDIMTREQRLDAVAMLDKYAARDSPAPPAAALWTQHDVVAALSNFGHSRLAKDPGTYKKSNEYKILSSSEKTKYTKALKLYHLAIATRSDAALALADMGNSTPAPSNERSPPGFPLPGSPPPNKMLIDDDQQHHTSDGDHISQTENKTHAERPNELKQLEEKANVDKDLTKVERLHNFCAELDLLVIKRLHTEHLNRAVEEEQVALVQSMTAGTQQDLILNALDNLPAFQTSATNTTLPIPQSDKPSEATETVATGELSSHVLLFHITYAFGRFETRCGPVNPSR